MFFIKGKFLILWILRFLLGKRLDIGFLDYILYSVEVGINFFIKNLDI